MSGRGRDSEGRKRKRERGREREREGEGGGEREGVSDWYKQNQNGQHFYVFSTNNEVD